MRLLNLHCNFMCQTDLFAKHSVVDSGGYLNTSDHIHDGIFKFMLKAERAEFKSGLKTNNDVIRRACLKRCANSSYFLKNKGTF